MFKSEKKEGGDSCRIEPFKWNEDGKSNESATPFSRGDTRIFSMPLSHLQVKKMIKQ